MRSEAGGASSLRDCATPVAVLDRQIVERNCRAMSERARRLGVKLRPHLKTSKCAAVARLATGGQFGGITVSTVAEARYFVGEGFKDITYAVGITPSKLEALAALQAGFGAGITLGSTPTAVFASSLEGVTEMRPGVYTLFDLDQVALGVCDIRDVALSVLATVIGHNPRSERVLIDAGALALSKDLSAAEFRDDVGYGLVCPAEGGVPIRGLRVADVHQEHGLIAGSGPPRELFGRLPVGSRVRILPNHACITAAPYERYQVVDGPGLEVAAEWGKALGW